MKNKITQSLSIFFPAYNEEENVTESALQALKVASEITDDYEVIIVDDGSTDKTAKIIDELAKKYSHFRAIHHKINQGYGGAVWTGVTNCTKDLIFFTDVDLQFKIDELKKFIPYIKEYDAVIGYRAPRRDPFMRLVNAWGWKVMINFLFNLGVRDIDCAFKLFKKDIFQKVSVESRGAMISAEMLIRIKKGGFKVKELPVGHYPRKAGSPTGAKPAVIAKAFKELLKVHKELKKESK